MCLGALAAGCGRSEVYDYSWPTLPVDAGAPPAPPVVCRLAEVQAFDLPAKPRQPIDVLFVIDDSCSMANDQKSLADNFGAFVPAFLSANVDFHIGVVTTDMKNPLRSGKLVAPVITPTTMAIEASFRNMVQVGVAGSGYEKGLAAAQAALSEPLRSTANKDFLRPDANLALVFLTDEEDQSDSLSAETFIAFLKGLKVEQDAITVASILGLKMPPYCTSSVAKWKYADVARAFLPRAHLSICSQRYSRTLQSIAGRIISGRCLVELRRKIDERRPVRVTVNGQPSEWSLIAPDPMRHYGTLEVRTCPDTAAHVEISYDDCEPLPE